MKAIRTAFAVALFTLAPACAPTPTYAATTTYAPVITVDHLPAVTVPVTFGTDAQCVTNRCQWSWDYPSGGAYKTGGQIGEGSSATYTFPASAASKPYVVVKVKVTSPGGTNNFVIGQRAFLFASEPRSNAYPYPPSCYSQYIYSYPNGYPVAVGAQAGCSQAAGGSGWVYQHVRAYVSCNGGGWLLSSWVLWQNPGTLAVKYCPSGTATAKSYQLAQ